ncbi:MAG: DMT family transporter [Desulfovibrionaceae bacterium]|nr:DMT family transporter [Desulfovibrionaceae bacterium]
MLQSSLLPENQMKNRMIGYLMVLVALSCWGLIGPLGRFGLNAGLEPMEVAFWRAAVGGLFFGIHAAVSGKWRIDIKRRIIFCLFGIPGVAVLFFVYQVGVKEAGASMTAILQYTAPIWVALWACLFFKEVITRIKALSIALSIGGAAMVCLSGGGLPQGASMLGLLAGLASGFLYSLHFLFAKKYLHDVSPVTLYMHILPVGALCMLPFIDFQIQTKPLIGVWLPTLALGFFTAWVGFLGYAEALKRLAVTQVAVTATLEPFVAAFFAFIWWDENFPALGWVGAALVVAAVIMSINPAGAHTDKS